MTDISTGRAGRRPALPDRSVVPPVWGRITNLDRRPRRGLVADHARRRALPRLHVGDRRHEHGPRPSAGRRRDRGAGGEAAPRPAEHRLPRARAAAVRAAGRPAAGRPVAAFLSNSGAEAVEAAVKLARVATGRPAIIAFRYGFHGRTAQAMALTAAKDVYRGAFEPLPGSVYHAAYPYCYRAAGGAARPGRLHLRLGGAARPAVPPARLPGQGRRDHRRAGPRRGRLHRPAARRSCRGCARSPAQHGILLIADEVQTGFGRTGELFAVRHWDVEPDILVMAKGIASGLPLSGILARRSSWTGSPPGSHGGTYGGNVVACAAANATLDVIEDEGLVANARERGAPAARRAAARCQRGPRRRSATSAASA